MKIAGFYNIDGTSLWNEVLALQTALKSAVNAVSSNASTISNTQRSLSNPGLTNKPFYQNILSAAMAQIPTLKQAADAAQKAYYDKLAQYNATIGVSATTPPTAATSPEQMQQPTVPTFNQNQPLGIAQIKPAQTPTKSFLNSTAGIVTISVVSLAIIGISIKILI